MSESLSEKPSSLEIEFDEHTLRMESLCPETVNTASKSGSLLLCLVYTLGLSTSIIFCKF